MSHTLGERVNKPIGYQELEVWPVTPALTEVCFETAELNARCPVTDQPDSYLARISFAPTAWTVESKSLKFYLWSFRDIGISAEDLAVRLSAELAERLECEVSVELQQSVRGGLSLTVRAHGRP